MVNKCIANKFTPVYLSGTVLCPWLCCYFSFSCQRINCGQTGRMEEPSHFSVSLLRLCSIPAKLHLDFFHCLVALGWFFSTFYLPADLLTLLSVTPTVPSHTWLPERTLLWCRCDCCSSPDRNRVILTSRPTERFGPAAHKPRELTQPAGSLI